MAKTTIDFTHIKDRPDVHLEGQMEKQDFIENEIIIITKRTLESLLGEKNFTDLLSLYVFYYYTAKWQKTNQPKCSTSYAAKGLHWGSRKVMAVKKQLVTLGLVEDVRDIDQTSKKVKGWYIKLKYIWKTENHPVSEPHSGLSHTVDSSTTNALSDSSLNALSETNKMLVPFLEEWKKITGDYPKDTKLNKIKNFNILTSKAKKLNVDPLAALKFFWNMNGRKNGEYIYYYRQGNLTTMIKLCDLLPKYLENQKSEKNEKEFESMKQSLLAKIKTNNEIY